MQQGARSITHSQTPSLECCRGFSAGQPWVPISTKLALDRNAWEEGPSERVTVSAAVGGWLGMQASPGRQHGWSLVARQLTQHSLGWLGVAG